MIYLLDEARGWKCRDGVEVVKFLPNFLFGCDIISQILIQNEVYCT